MMNMETLKFGNSNKLEVYKIGNIELPVQEGGEFLAKSKNFEGGYEIEILSNGLSEFPLYKHCKGIIRDETGAEAIFYQCLETKQTDDFDEEIDFLINRFNQLKRIFQHYHSLTNGQCKQAISDYKKKYK